MALDRKLSSGEFAGRFVVSVSAVSQHLVLKTPKVVHVRIEVSRRIHELDPEGFWNSTIGSSILQF